MDGLNRQAHKHTHTRPSQTLPFLRLREESRLKCDFYTWNFLRPVSSLSSPNCTNKFIGFPDKRLTLTEENALHRTTIIVIERKGRGVNSVRMQKGNYTQRELYSGWGGGGEEEKNQKEREFVGEKRTQPDEKKYKKQ